MKDLKEELERRIEVLKKAGGLEKKTKKICDILIKSLKNGGKVILCGNGGSASDSSHIAAEFLGKVKYKDARSLPAINLSSDPAVVTAIANDYGFEYVFSKQIEAMGNKNDVLIVFSTSGRSKNIVNAIQKAKDMGLRIIYFTGRKKPLKGEICDLVVNLPTDDKQIIQELYMILWHIVVNEIEERMEE